MKSLWPSFTLTLLAGCIGLTACELTGTSRSKDNLSSTAAGGQVGQNDNSGNTDPNGQNENPVKPDPINFPSVSSLATWQNFAIPKQGSNVHIEWTSVPSASPMDGVVGFAASGIKNYSDSAVSVRFGSSGIIEARNGNVYAAVTPISYVAGTSYRFKVDIDLATHTFSAWVTPMGQSEIAVATDYSFRTEQIAIDAINYWGLIALTGSFSVSDLSVLVSSDASP